MAEGTGADVAPMKQISMAEFRKELAGFIDHDASRSTSSRKELHDVAVRFAAMLPELYGESLDRLDLWERIGSGIQTAFAKTVGADHEFFISEVLKHILAPPGASAANEHLAEVLDEVSSWSDTDRQAWMRMCSTHLTPILLYARRLWEERKGSKR